MMETEGDGADAQRLAEFCERGPFPAGWHVHFAATSPSTQDTARAAAYNGAASRTAFVADYQAAGRGRQGRHWTAPRGSSLLMSLLFREEREHQPQRFTMLTALALAEAIDEVASGVRASIKWPNDLMIDGRKCAGTIAESFATPTGVWVVVGCGTNVNVTRADLDRVGLGAATSLAIAGGRTVERAWLLRTLLGRLDIWLQVPWNELHAAWSERLWARGQRLLLREVDGIGARGTFFGTVLGADATGGLRVRLADGREVTSFNAEIIL